MKIDRKQLENLAIELSEFVDNWVHDKGENPNEGEIFSFLRGNSKVIYHLENIEDD